MDFHNYKTKNYKIFLLYWNTINFYWGYQAVGKDYYLDPDKIRGNISTIYNFTSTVYTSLFFLLLILGAKKFLMIIKSFNFYIMGKNILISTIFFNIWFSSKPLLNFLTYYFLGLNKFGTRNQDFFGSNQWGEKYLERSVS